VDAAKRAELLAQYRDGYRLVAEAVAGLTDAELDRPAPEGWTARQVVHHLADSEMTSAIRLRRLIAEDKPLIVGYDEQLFANTLFYDRPIAASLNALKAARETTAEILDRLSETQWQRCGTHSESGPYSVQTWLELYAEHGADHAAQIRRALGRT
jgi:hypothetical protein